MADPAARRHLFIAGTGRAGTSFLVRFLAGMGLHTHLQQHEQPRWHEAANAGLEDIPIGERVQWLPYVVKTPWLSSFIDDVLANPAIAIDAVLVPVRDLADAATSRAVIEQRHIHATVPWMAEAAASTEIWGSAPGGMVFSLNPLDQGRLLAVWFHQLVHRLVQADVPMVLLDFPRLARDPDYLFAKVQPWLPPGATLAQARQVHGEIADPAKIRVEAERAEDASAAGTVQPGVGYPSPAAVDRLAIRRELVRLHRAAGEAEAEVQRLRAALAAGAAEAEALRQSLAAARAPLGVAAAMRAVAAALRRRHGR